MQDILGDECPLKATIYRWIGRFDNGDEELHDDPCPGRPTSSKTSSNIERVQTILDEDRRITLRELEDKVGISKATLHSIITEDLEMSKVTARGSQNIQKNKNAKGSELARNQFQYISKTESKQWKRGDEPVPIKVKAAKSAGKRMATVLWDMEGKTPRLVAEKTTINNDYYVDKLKNCIKRLNVRCEAS
ncbi:Histone-lysine N-methyltransferase SETMAR-like [Oopsacas minuta]|uniref:Histone-lysine N-methyltransferase SETMAR-like n=1 Tax=Oopsacas minuta TaxID=111878 RepID=A0AAV7JWD3_9METZ|nr:Histone-lysine N-methyltransferase SETMAR-like [Oopsacas minuta]